MNVTIKRHEPESFEVDELIERFVVMTNNDLMVIINDKTCYFSQKHVFIYMIDAVTKHHNLTSNFDKSGSFSFYEKRVKNIEVTENAHYITIDIFC